MGTIPISFPRFIPLVYVYFIMDSAKNRKLGYLKMGALTLLSGFAGAGLQYYYFGGFSLEVLVSSILFGTLNLSRIYRG